MTGTRLQPVLRERALGIAQELEVMNQKVPNKELFDIARLKNQSVSLHYNASYTIFTIQSLNLCNFQSL